MSRPEGGACLGNAPAAAQPTAQPCPLRPSPPKQHSGLTRPHMPATFTSRRPVRLGFPPARRSSTADATGNAKAGKALIKDGRSSQQTQQCLVRPLGCRQPAAYQAVGRKLGQYRARAHTWLNRTRSGSSLPVASLSLCTRVCPAMLAHFPGQTERCQLHGRTGSQAAGKDT